MLLPAAFGQATNAITPLIAPPLPDAGLSFVRVLGALVLVIGLFLGGVWFFKNWQRLAVQHADGEVAAGHMLFQEHRRGVGERGHEREGSRT